MKDYLLDEYEIDFIEIFTPMAKVLAYWHTKALGFSTDFYADTENSTSGISSYVLTCGKIKLQLTSSYPTLKSTNNGEITAFISQNYCGVKRIALRVKNVTEVFDKCVLRGAFPVKFPQKTNDENGSIEEAAIKLFDQSELVFINRDSYNGDFKPGFKKINNFLDKKDSFFTNVDHVASELRINESKYWSEYLTRVLDTQTVQNFEESQENKTGMVLRVNQSFDKKLTIVIAEPASYLQKSKLQNNLDTYGPGIHHLAFATNDLIKTIKELTQAGVDFVKIPSSYYDLLRDKEEFKNFDINILKEAGILIDKEGETYLLQKFIKPLSDRPFFFYEFVQRVNGYSGFALNNINVLKKAEEMEIMKS